MEQAPHQTNQNEDIHYAESSEKKLAYVDGFKELVKEHPGIIGTFKKLEKELLEKLKEVDEDDRDPDISVREDGVTISTLYSNSGTHDELGRYWKVSVGDETFFVKRVSGYRPSSLKPGGVDEITSLQEAKKLLKDIQGVDVIDYQIGYQDKKGTTYFVSKWTDGVRLDVHLNRLSFLVDDIEKDHPEAIRLRDKLDAIKKILTKNFSDVEEYNAMFNPETKKLTIFDIYLDKKIYLEKETEAA